MLCINRFQMRNWLQYFPAKSVMISFVSFFYFGSMLIYSKVKVPIAMLTWPHCTYAAFPITVNLCSLYILNVAELLLLWEPKLLSLLTSLPSLTCIELLS